jgi:hypothetical protein
MILKLVAFILVGYYTIDAVVVLFRNFDNEFVRTIDAFRSFASSIINAAVRGVTLFAYAVIIEYLREINAKR